MKSSRSTRVRTKVVALLLSLIALWAFAAFVTVREGLNLLWAAQLDAGVSRPTEGLVAQLQTERRLSLVYLSGRTEAQRQEMLGQRSRTDAEKQTVRASVATMSAQWASDASIRANVAAMFASLDALDEARRTIDNGGTDRIAAAAAFTGVIDDAFAIFGDVAGLDDQDLAKEARSLVGLSRGRELLSQQDALLSGALAAGGFRGAEQAQFAQLVGAQRFAYAEAARNLPSDDLADYEKLVRGSNFSRLRAIEDTAIISATSGVPLSVSTADWRATVEPVQEQLRQLELTGGDRAVSRASQAAIGTLVRLLLAGGLGLVAVIASIVISITTARNLVRQLERLRNAARDLASYRLPRVVERLQQGERVDVDAEAPPLDFGRDEIGQVGEAFNQVQETAIRVAVEQAELRRSVRDVFLSLARRSQALLHRQLGLLDAMERRATDSEELAELFRIDHLATRMRRNAENLIVLSGATAGRAWRKPVAMVDVLRGALAEVEDYTRVTVLPVGSASLLGRAVGDVIHLLAELIENAVSFSPPQTVVRVGGSVVGYGYAIEIEDRGLGMSPEELETANEQLRNPPEFRLTSTARLGLYVVGKLAERHGIKVRLTESAYGGTTAIVLLPGTLMADTGGADEIRPAADEEPENDGRPVQLAGVGRHRLPAAGNASPGSDGALRTPPAGADLRTVPAGADLRTPVAGADFRTPGGAPPTGNGNGNGVPGPATTNGNGRPASAPYIAQSALTGLTPVTGTPAIPPPAAGGLTPNGLPTRPVPAQAGPPAQAPPVTGPAPGAGPAEPPRPPAPAPAAPHQLTPAGLPWRQRPASPAESTPGTPPAGWTAVTPVDGTPGTAAGTADPGPTTRGPDQTRSMMTSYRSGTLRGRTDAARLTGPEAGETGPWPDSAPPVEPVPFEQRTPSAAPPEWTPSTPAPEEEG